MSWRIENWFFNHWSFPTNFRCSILSNRFKSNEIDLKIFKTWPGYFYPVLLFNTNILSIPSDLYSSLLFTFIWNKRELPIVTGSLRLRAITGAGGYNLIASNKAHSRYFNWVNVCAFSGLSSDEITVSNSAWILL